VLEKIGLGLHLFSVFIPIAIISLILFWPLGVFYNGDVWPIVWISLFLLFFLVIFENLIVDFFSGRFAGKEVMEISQEGIVIRHQIFGFGISRRYLIDQLKYVFVTRYRDKNDWQEYMVYRRSYGILLFKY
jgi:hypothetical protein